MKALTRRMIAGVPMWLVLAAFALSGAASVSLLPLTPARGYDWNTSTVWVQDTNSNVSFRATFLKDYYWTCAYSCALRVGDVGAWVNITRIGHSYNHIEYALTSDASVGEWYQPVDFTFTYYNTPQNIWHSFNRYVQGVSGYYNYVSTTTCYSQTCQFGYKDGAYVEAAIYYNNNNPFTYESGIPGP
ncbi:MAG: hypothetical protein IT429_19965 [Gemmataceae bacterium]|nr:hypothetical protein [Gemmataceae bacterium]